MLNNYYQDMAIEEVITKEVTCKNCGSTAVVKFGSYKGTPRYWCKACKRKFKDDADLFHMKVPADYVSKWCFNVLCGYECK